MDFHSLARRDLQAICKKNKIPANITNVNMADALAALQHVEGIEEFINQSESKVPQSPERPEIGSPAIPLTRGRASTRRRATKESVSSISVTQTRRGTRRVVTEDLNQENEDVMVNETPVMPSCRRRAPATYSRRKLETQMKDAEDDEKNMGEAKTDVPKTPAMQNTGSVQRVYSTRRTVRMLEKTMGELTLKEEKGGNEPDAVAVNATEGTKIFVEPAKEEDVHGIDAGSHVKANSNALDGEDQNAEYESSLSSKNCSMNVEEEGGYQMKTFDSHSVTEENLDNHEDQVISSDLLESKGPEIPEYRDSLFEDAEQHGPKCTATELSCKNLVTKESPKKCDDEEMKCNTYTEESPEEDDEGKIKYNTDVLVDVEVTESLGSAITICGSNQSMGDKNLYLTADQVPDIQEYTNLETLVDVDVKPEIEFAVVNNRCSPAPGERPTPIKETIPQCFLVYRDGEVEGDMQSLSASRNSNQKQLTVEKSVLLIEEVDKENIDNSGRTQEPVKEISKEEENLHNKSLRKLKKLLKTLAIADKEKNDNKNVNDVQHLEETMRLPLAKLP